MLQNLPLHKYGFQIHQIWSQFSLLPRGNFHSGFHHAFSLSRIGLSDFPLKKFLSFSYDCLLLKNSNFNGSPGQIYWPMKAFSNGHDVLAFPPRFSSSSLLLFVFLLAQFTSFLAFLGDPFPEEEIIFFLGGLFLFL